MGFPVYNVSPRIQYTAAAAQTVFVVPFSFFANTDLLVYQNVAGVINPSDAGSLLTYAVNYTVSGAGTANGGQITLLAGATLNDVVTIVRAMPETRPLSSLYLAGGQFTADQVNNDFGMDVMMDQQNQMRVQTLTPHYQDSQINLGVADLWLQQLPVGYSWRKNATNTFIEAFLPGNANPVNITNTQTVRIAITQVAHGLAAGNVVRCSGVNTFAKAQANSAANAEVIGLVDTVVDADNFTLVCGGLITAGLAGLVAGTNYYLDPAVAGGLTAVRPVAVTQVVKPLLIAIGAGSAVWTNMLGIVL